MQFYTDPSREQDPHALPDAETFELANRELLSDFRQFVLDRMAEDDTLLPSDLHGWYWWPCFPGCLPDGDPVGPFKSEDLAIADARKDGAA